MNLLAQQPYTLTDLSRILKVSKPTVSYHLSDFARKGLIEGAGVRVGRGGLTSKLYVMKHGIELILPDSDSDTYYLDLLSGIFEANKLEWTTSNGEKRLGDGMINFLYHAFRLLRNVTKTRHHDVLRRYGIRVGKEVVGPKMRGNGLHDKLVSLADFWQANDMGNVQLSSSSMSYMPLQLFQCLGCFGARENGGPLCSFTRGIIEGALQLSYGTRYEVGERQSQGSSYELCLYPVRKTRKRNLVSYSEAESGRSRIT